MTGIDGYDWSVFGGNPVPGDPDAVRAQALSLRDLADTASTQHGTLAGVGISAQAVWSGPAADNFHPTVTKLTGQLATLARSHDDAADALDAYWPVLRDAQQTALTALARANAATAALADARAAAEAATSSAASAGSAFDQATTASASAASTAPPTPATTSQLQSLQAAYTQAQAHAAGCGAAVSAATAELTAAHQLKDAAVTQAGAASSRCASALKAASNAGIHNPHHSWLQSALHDTLEAALVVTPGGFLFTSEGRSLLKFIEPGLKEFSKIVGDVSLGLSVLAFVPVVGEFAEVANEALIGLKTAADAGLVLDGDKAAEAELAMDGMLAATGGLGRIFGRAVDAGETLGDATEAAGKLTGATDRLTEANATVDDATALLHDSGVAERSATYEASVMRGQAAMADHFGDDGSVLLARADDAEATAASAGLAAKGAQATIEDASMRAAEATSELPGLQAEADDAKKAADAWSSISRTDAAVGYAPAALRVSALKDAIADTGFKQALSGALGDAGITRLTPSQVLSYYGRYLSNGPAAVANLTTRVVDAGADGAFHVLHP